MKGLWPLLSPSVYNNKININNRDCSLISLLTTLLKGLGIASGFVCTLFGLWQLDLISSDPVWKNGWHNKNYANRIIELGRLFGHKFQMQVGDAYDFCQALIVLGVIIEFLTVFL